MAVLEIRNLSFQYPGRAKPALSKVNILFRQSEFTVIYGKTGCGKTTLLRHLKPILTPAGKTTGDVYYLGKQLASLDAKTQAEEIGFVMQAPDDQLITDKVWHELAFGLENLGMADYDIRLRVAEMASFFGIESWLEKSVYELSGGQKQLVNLAAIMATQPRFLILDEPTSQLDPVAAREFFNTIQQINQDLGTGVIMTEQRLEEVLPLVDRAVIMKDGEIIADGTPSQTGRILHESGDNLFYAMPAAMRIYAETDNSEEYPLTVREGRLHLDKLLADSSLKTEQLPPEQDFGKTILRLKDVYFRYGRYVPEVVSGLNLNVYSGKLNCVLGGNGSGKTTTLLLMCGLLKPYRGKVYLHGKELGKYRSKELYGDYFALLPQNPLSLFVRNTVGLDLAEMLDNTNASESEKGRKIAQLVDLMEINHILDAHPYELSGGEQQKVALAKILLKEPQVILLDEPTKGMDGYFKHKLAVFLRRLAEEKGVAVVMASHDIEFCAMYGDVCSLFFGGKIISSGEPRRFFAGNSFYTTSANRICRHIWPYAVTVNDVLAECKKLKA